MTSAPSALEAALERVDEIADRMFAGWNVPGLAYGVVPGGELVHSPRPWHAPRRRGRDAGRASSVFRIASMTKSFTAATVLSLRDEGRLTLDDPIDRYVPELASLRYPTTDSPPITIRHLLTMSAGFPTDDPWGDRQQSLDLDAFKRLLAGGLSFAWTPGTRFEYSNTGYGVLGRLITNVAGREYREVVRERILQPLGMDVDGLSDPRPTARNARVTCGAASATPKAQRWLRRLCGDGRPSRPSRTSPHGCVFTRFVPAARRPRKSRPAPGRVAPRDAAADGRRGNCLSHPRLA